MLTLAYKPDLVKRSHKTSDIKTLTCKSGSVISTNIYNEAEKSTCK